MNTAEKDSPTDIIHRSPGITAIYNELKSSNRNNVLDLGSASAGSFTFFSRLSCHIHFEGINNFFAEDYPSWNSSEALRTELDNYLSEFGEDKRFDVILAWDIFNYIDQSTLQWLIARLNRYCYANTLLHSIKYLGRNLPATPRHFQVIDQYQVKMSGVSALCTRPFPNMDTNTTLKNMPGYTMENTYVQQEGMARDIAEHVLRYQSESKSNKRQLASAEISRTAGLLPPGVEAHRSYGLENICTYLRKLPNASVLDLGSKATHSGDFLLEYAEQVYVEDIMPSLTTSASTTNEDSIRQHALRYAPEIKFDVILVWDLFNYCSPAQLAAIYKKLYPHLHNETKIFMLLYTGAELPIRPQKCFILDEKNIALQPSPKQTATKEELTAIALLKVFREFHLANTYILQPGMHRGVFEYIFQATSEALPRR